MLWRLLVKDLRRARRNPWPYLIHLSLPLVITALIGIAFGGGSSKDKGLGKIKVAMVDEDDSVLSGLLRGALNQGQAKQYLEPSFVTRAEGLRLINRNQVSAVWIIPKGFTRDFLLGDTTARFELIKNPAQSFYPAIVEEALRVAVTGLNAIARNLRPDFPEWLAVIETEGEPNMKKIAALIERVGNYLFPPLVSYSRATVQKEKDGGPAANIFGYLLPGLAAMFLLFLADTSVRDVYREVEARTFDRFRTVHHRTLSFVISKVVLAMTVLLIAGAILFVGGAMIFRITWGHPFQIAALVLAYALFAAGLMSTIAALARSERRADVFNSIIALGLALVGGSMFPVRQLPPIFRDHISPSLPSYWFIESVRSLESGSTEVIWTWAFFKLAIVGFALVLFASWWLQRSLQKGVRA
jgi:ABC-2 type transport system permease protein